jgi:hypothetical protein
LADKGNVFDREIFFTLREGLFPNVAKTLGSIVVLRWAEIKTGRPFDAWGGKVKQFEFDQYQLSCQLSTLSHPDCKARRHHNAYFFWQLLNVTFFPLSGGFALPFQITERGAAYA